MVDHENEPRSVCRICQIVQEDAGQLIKPCNCNGSMEFVHTTCLQNWIAVSSRLICEICKCRYQGRKICRYSVFTSIVPYVKARWNQPKINFLLLIIFHLFERMYAEVRDFYYRRRKYQQNIVKFYPLKSAINRYLNYLAYPQTFVLMLLAFRDWSEWRQTQIVFVLDR